MGAWRRSQADLHQYKILPSPDATVKPNPDSFTHQSLRHSSRSTVRFSYEEAVQSQRHGRSMRNRSRLVQPGQKHFGLPLSKKFTPCSKQHFMVSKHICNNPQILRPFDQFLALQHGERMGFDRNTWLRRHHHEGSSGGRKTGGADDASAVETKSVQDPQRSETMTTTAHVQDNESQNHTYTWHLEQTHKRGRGPRIVKKQTIIPYLSRVLIRFASNRGCLPEECAQLYHPKRSFAQTLKRQALEIHCAVSNTTYQTQPHFAQLCQTQHQPAHVEHNGMVAFEDFDRVTARNLIGRAPNFFALHIANDMFYIGLVDNQGGVRQAPEIIATHHPPLIVRECRTPKTEFRDHKPCAPELVISHCCPFLIEPSCRGACLCKHPIPRGEMRRLVLHHICGHVVPSWTFSTDLNQDPSFRGVHAFKARHETQRLLQRTGMATRRGQRPQHAPGICLARKKRTRTRSLTFSVRRCFFALIYLREREIDMPTVTTTTTTVVHEGGRVCTLTYSHLLLYPPPDLPCPALCCVRRQPEFRITNLTLRRGECVVMRRVAIPSHLCERMTEPLPHAHAEGSPNLPIPNPTEISATEMTAWIFLLPPLPSPPPFLLAQGGLARGQDPSGQSQMRILRKRKECVRPWLGVPRAEFCVSALCSSTTCGPRSARGMPPDCRVTVGPVPAPQVSSDTPSPVQHRLRRRPPPLPMCGTMERPEQNEGPRREHRNPRLSGRSLRILRHFRSSFPRDLMTSTQLVCSP